MKGQERQSPKEELGAVGHDRSVEWWWGIGKDLGDCIRNSDRLISLERWKGFIEIFSLTLLISWVRRLIVSQRG